MKKRLMTVLVMLTLMICVLPMVVSADECNHSWNNYQGICGECQEQHAHDKCWSGSCSICGYDVSWQHPDYYPVDEHCDACGGCLDASNQSWDSDNHWYVCNQNHIVDQETHNIVDGACTDCDYEIPHEHSWSYTEIPTTGTHTKSCGCGVSETETCSGCDVTDCSKCGSELLGIHPDNDEEGHCDYCEACLSPKWTVKYDSTNHWYECTCGEKYYEDAHEYEGGVCECGHKEEISHDHSWSYTEIPTTGTHTKSCGCGVSETETCSGCDITGCSKCSSELLGIHPDNDEEGHCDYCKACLDPHWTLKYDATNHWHECTCGEKYYEKAHEYEDGVCECGHEKSAESAESEEATAAPAAPGTGGLDYVPKTGSVLIEWLYTLIFG